MGVDNRVYAIIVHCLDFVIAILLVYFLVLFRVLLSFVRLGFIRAHSFAFIIPFIPTPLFRNSFALNVASRSLFRPLG